MTIDHTRPDPLADDTPALPAFTPIPRHYKRHDGWTPERQHGFIEALALTGSVRAAAHAVNMTPEGAYQLRRHPQAGSFRKAWEAALATGVQRLEDIAMDRALNGVETPVYSYGKLIGTRVVYNDRLLMFLLRNRAPKRFAEGQRSAAFQRDPTEAARMARLRKAWRKEWDAERAAEDDEDNQDTLDSIDTFIDRMRERRLAAMSPRTRELLEAYEKAMAEDEARYFGRAGALGEDAGEEGEEDYALPRLEHREAEEERPEDGPRVRTVKDDSWE